MTHRVYCFNAGPAQLPLPVLQEVQQEMLDYKSSGMSVMELSHRSPEYAEIHTEAQNNFKELLDMDDDWKILFLPGGSSTQFYMLPLNFLAGGKKADYVNTGTWSKKAIKEANWVGDIQIAHNAANEDGKFLYVPTQDQLDLRSDAVYLHFTTNNTIAGTQWQDLPKPPTGTFLAADMCSDMLWRKFDTSRFGVFYASAQKNLGPAGVTVVAIRQSILDKCADDVPSMLKYKLQIEKDSLFNTGPTFPTYLVGKVLTWLKSIGGLDEMERRNREKADLLYGIIDADPEYWFTTVQKTSRSCMNVVWRIKNDETLEKQFIAEAKTAGLVGLKGHRSVGGLRASIYNAIPLEGVKALADFMAEFRRKNG